MILQPYKRHTKGDVGEMVEIARAGTERVARARRSQPRGSWIQRDPQGTVLRQIGLLRDSLFNYPPTLVLKPCPR